MTVGGNAGWLRSAEGRLRLGWRLTAFLALGVVVFMLLAVLLPSGMLTVSFGMLVGSVVAGVVLLGADGRPPAALGFHSGRTAPGELAKGVALGIALGLLVVGLTAAVGGVRWTGQSGDVGDWLWRGAGALAFLAVPAAAEEAFLRGYPLQALAEAWGPLTALVVTSVAFGLLHLGNPAIGWLAVANIALAGAFLGAVYLRTGSLWWATGAHLGWNWALGYLADTPVSGLELMDAPFYEGVWRGPAWLGGGAFGPEGGVAATVGVLAAAVWCWRTPRLAAGDEVLASRPLAWSAGVPGGPTKNESASDRDEKRG